MTHNEFEISCWAYYLFLEKSYLSTTRYVYLSKNNFKCYSFEFTNLLLSISIELENVIKIIFNELNIPKEEVNAATLTGICKYFIPVKARLFNNQPKVKIKNTKIFLEPYLNFCSGKSNWWSKYNNVKHNRQINFKFANQENVLNALAALYILNSLYMIANPQIYKIDTEYLGVDAPEKNSSLFIPENFKFKVQYDNIISYDMDNLIFK